MSNLQHLIQCFTGMIDLGYEIGFNSDYEKFNNRVRPRDPPCSRARVVHRICSIFLIFLTLLTEFKKTLDSFLVEQSLLSQSCYTLYLCLCLDEGQNAGGAGVGGIEGGAPQPGTET